MPSPVEFRLRFSRDAKAAEAKRSSPPKRSDHHPKLMRYITAKPPAMSYASLGRSSSFQVD
jgi:hypothetical protein